MNRLQRFSASVLSGRNRSQAGFIPMLLMLFFVLVVVIIFAFRRVLQAQS